MAAKRKRALALPPSVVATAESLARIEGRPVEALVSKAVQAYAKTRRAKRNHAAVRRSRRGTQDLWGTIAGPFEDLPASVLRKLPRDAARNHDRYIYGRP